MPTLSPQTTPYYGGGQVQAPADVFKTSGAPSTADVHRNLGSIGIDNATAHAWILASKSGGTATWTPIGGGAISLSTLTGNSGVAVPVAGNINVLGGTNLTSVGGSPTGDDLTINLDSSISGLTLVSSTSFETSNAAAGITWTGSSFTADGTDTDIDISITPKGTGSVLMDSRGAVGTGTADNSSTLTLDASNFNIGMLIYGTNTVAAGNCVGIYIPEIFSRTGASASDFIGVSSAPTITTTAGTLSGVCASYFSNPVITGNAGTISFLAGIYAGSGTGTDGTVTAAYGGYFNDPVFGTNKAAIYSDNLSVGYAGVSPPTAGAIISGDVGIGLNNPVYPLDLLGTALGGTQGNSSVLAQFAATDSNTDQLRIYLTRTANGADWETADMVLQRVVDVTNQAYVNFYAAGSSLSGIKLGTSTGDILTLTPAGFAGVGTIAPATRLETEENITLVGNVTDGYAASYTIDPGYTVADGGTYTIDRYNYLDLNQPSETETSGTITITDGAVMRFDAAAGTHVAVDAGTTKTTPGTVDAWVKVNINGTIYYLPAYTSKTT